MADVKNSETIKNLREAAQLSSAIENPPLILSNTIVPTIEINPRLSRICNIIKSSTGGTLYTTPAQGKFYLNSVYMSMSKAVADAMSEAHINIVVNGLTIQVIRLQGVTLTAETHDLSISFPIPIIVDPASSISCSATGAGGSVYYGITGVQTYNEVNQ
jgi:hypothetical protein